MKVFVVESKDVSDVTDYWMIESIWSTNELADAAIDKYKQELRSPYVYFRTLPIEVDSPYN